MGKRKGRGARWQELLLVAALVAILFLIFDNRDMRAETRALGKEVDIFIRWCTYVSAKTGIPLPETDEDSDDAAD